MPDIITSLRWQDLLDILIVSYIIYRAILLIRGTRAVQMLLGIVIITFVYFGALALDLLTLHWLLRTFLSSIFLVVIIVFQQDIRRALTQVGKTPFHKSPDIVMQDLEDIVKAVSYLAKRRIGALIVIERDTGLRDYIESGQRIDAKLSRDLLISLFLPASPLHDGAVVVHNSRIHSAGCLLPLTQNPLVNKRFGTRHRAAIGLSEETDAVVIVLSEETQMTSLVQHGAITTFHDETSFANHLQSQFIAKEHSGYPWKNWFNRPISS